MPIYYDGNFLAGAPVLATATGNYVCNSFSLEKSAETTAIINENGSVSGHIQWLGDRTGTAEVQYANNVPALCVASDNVQRGVFLNVNIDGTNANCFITSVSEQKPQRGQWTASVQFTVRVNP